MDYDHVSDAVKGQAKREREACKAAVDSEKKAKKTKKTIAKKEPKFGDKKRCGTPNSDVAVPCQEFYPKDHEDKEKAGRCTTCKRKPLNKSKGGGAKKPRKFDKERCKQCSYVTRDGRRVCRECKRGPPH